MNRLLLLSFLLLFVVTNVCYSQETNYATNVRTTPRTDEKKMFVEYDLVANDGTRFFNVILELIYEGQPVIPNTNNLFGDYGRAITPGNKIIYWNYKDDFNKDINKLEVNVIAYQEKEPKAEFEFSTESGNLIAPCKLIFNNLSSNSDRYEWNFGDANSGIENNSFEKNPSHTYEKGGRYTISLKAYNSVIKLESETNEDVIIQEHKPTVADFKIIGSEYKKSTVPVIIELKNLSENADKFIWDFGDPQSGRTQNTSEEFEPSHRYMNRGQYTIELTAKNTSSGISDVKKLDLVLSGKPVKEKPEPAVSSDYKKHKTKKTIWLASTITTAAVGTGLLLKSNSLHNDYESATTDAKEIREQFETLDKIYPVAFGAAVLSGVMTAIHAKKQANAKARIGFQVLPIQDGGLATLSLNF